MEGKIEEKGEQRKKWEKKNGKRLKERWRYEKKRQCKEIKAGKEENMLE